jgi:hypothetical protein
MKHKLAVWLRNKLPKDHPLLKWIIQNKLCKVIVLSA